MRVFVFLDLDDTILQTRPKCPAGVPLHPAAYGRDGQPLSFMTPGQRTLWDMLAAAGTIIPTTARNLDALRRVALPFAHVAILDFGGVVLLPDGRLDPAWDRVIRPKALAGAACLHDAFHSVQAHIEKHGLGARARLIVDFELPLYLVIKHPHGDLAALRAIRDEHPIFREDAAFFVHSNGNNLSLVPKYLGKERAVRHVMAHRLGTEPVFTIGVGDSLTDAAFLDLCDYRLLPRDCQLAATLRSPPKAADV